MPIPLIAAATNVLGAVLLVTAVGTVLGDQRIRSRLGVRGIRGDQLDAEGIDALQVVVVGTLHEGTASVLGAQHVLGQGREGASAG